MDGFRLQDVCIETSSLPLEKAMSGWGMHTILCVLAALVTESWVLGASRDPTHAGGFTFQRGVLDWACQGVHTTATCCARVLSCPAKLLLLRTYVVEALTRIIVSIFLVSSTPFFLNSHCQAFARIKDRKKQQTAAHILWSVPSASIVLTHLKLVLPYL